MNSKKKLADCVLNRIKPEIYNGIKADGSYSQEKVESVDESIEYLKQVINKTELSSNPDYHVMGDLAAELINFSFDHPEHFSEIFDDSEIEWTKNIDITTADGLFKMYSLVRALGDNHSFALDESGSVPKVVGDWQLGPKTKLLNLRELHSSLEAYRLSIQRSLKEKTAVIPGI